MCLHGNPQCGEFVLLRGRCTAGIREGGGAHPILRRHRTLRSHSRPVCLRFRECRPKVGPLIGHSPTKVTNMPQATSHKEQALPAVSCSGVTRHPSNEIRPIKEIAVKNMIGNLRCEWSLAGQPPLRAVVARTKRNSRQNIIGNHRCKRWFAGANCALGPRALLCVLTVVLLCR